MSDTDKVDELAKQVLNEVVHIDRQLSETAAIYEVDLVQSLVSSSFHDGYLEGVAEGTAIEKERSMFGDNPDMRRAALEALGRQSQNAYNMGKHEGLEQGRAEGAEQGEKEAVLRIREHSTYRSNLPEAGYYEVDAELLD